MEPASTFVPQCVQKAVLDVPRWTVREDAVIGLFSFTKFLMWLDLAERSDVLAESAVVRHLVEAPGTPFDDGVELPPADAADRRDPGTVLCPMDADASQLRAVLAAEAGKSFVLQGPPGTGKSQTITNLIAHCLAAVHDAGVIHKDINPTIPLSSLADHKASIAIAGNVGLQRQDAPRTPFLFGQRC